MRSRFLPKPKLSEDFALQITSMADIFIILLVFLLKSYATNLTSIAPTGMMILPMAQSKEEVAEALQIEITPDSVLVDKETVITLSNFEFSGSADKALKVVKEKLQGKRKSDVESTLGSRLIVMADERTPYETLEGVLAAASGTGFVDLQLIVVQEE